MASFRKDTAFPGKENFVLGATRRVDIPYGIASFTPFLQSGPWQRYQILTLNAGKPPLRKDGADCNIYRRGAET